MGITAQPLVRDDRKPEAQVTNSRFFSAAFNTAIIDGPLRIYFSDQQEADALRIYFDVQETLGAEGIRLNSFTVGTTPFYLMLYPTKELFSEIFETTETTASELFGRSLLLGVNGPADDETRRFISSQILTAFHNVPSI